MMLSDREAFVQSLKNHNFSQENQQKIAQEHSNQKSTSSGSNNTSEQNQRERTRGIER